MRPCTDHVVFHDGCAACILWRVEVHRIITDALDMCDDVLGVEAII